MQREAFGTVVIELRQVAETDGSTYFIDLVDMQPKIIIRRFGLNQTKRQKVSVETGRNTVGLISLAFTSW